MTLDALLDQLRSAPDTVEFSTVMAVIDEHYHYTPQAFSNGLDERAQHNAAGSNEGSCKIFAFAALHQLDPAQTLACFGDFYRRDVLQHPEAQDHGNIRSFMRDGWAGVRFDAPPLRAK